MRLLRLLLLAVLSIPIFITTYRCRY